MSELALNGRTSNQVAQRSCPHLSTLLSPRFIQELEIAERLIQESGEYALALSIARWRARLVGALQTAEVECPIVTELWLG